MESSGDDVSRLDLVKIVEVPGKGLGIVATRDADPGQVVARERSPIAISVDVNHLGARCSRCAGRGPRPGGATHRCRNGCGAAWCSPECARVDEALHVDSGECSFLLDIGPHRPEKQGTCQPCGPGDRHTGRRKVDMDWVMLADDVRLLLRAKHGGILEGGDERLAELDLGAECPNSSWEIGGAGSHSTLRRIATIAAQTYRQSTGGDAIPEDAEASGSLLDDDDDGSWVTAARIVFSNSFDVDAWAMSPSMSGTHAYPRVSRVAGAVYKTLSRFNHSCVPNCSWSFVPQGTPGSVGAASVAVRAIKPVKEGDELTISYADPTVGRDERRETLWDKYRFDCACALCVSPRNENRQLLGIDPFLEAVHCNVKDDEIDGVIEETERMIHDVRVALRSIQSEEDVKKLDLAVNKLKTKMISRTIPFMKDTEKKGLRWNYAGEGRRLPPVPSHEHGSARDPGRGVVRQGEAVDVTRGYRERRGDQVDEDGARVFHAESRGAGSPGALLRGGLRRRRGAGVDGGERTSDDLQRPRRQRHPHGRGLSAARSDLSHVKRLSGRGGQRRRRRGRFSLLRGGVSPEP